MKPTRAIAAQPRVDPLAVILTIGIEAETRITPQPTHADPHILFALARAGFGQRRKQLRNTLASGLHWSKEDAERLLEKYPDNNKTPEALLYKGRALAQMPGHKTEGANEFREVIRRFPRTDQGRMACEDLKSLGYNCPVASAAAPKKGTPARKK